jgi:DNA-binding NarL/FixJ family response regulator
MDLIPIDEDIVQFVNAGVSGFVLKDAQIASAASAQGREHPLEDVRTTRHEREVIGPIGEGLSDEEIAPRLTIAANTVKSHVRNVMEKLALHTRLQIAAYACRDGPQ